MTDIDLVKLRSHAKIHAEYDGRMALEADTVLALLDRLERAEKERDQVMDDGLPANFSVTFSPQSIDAMLERAEARAIKAEAALSAAVNAEREACENIIIDTAQALFDVGAEAAANRMIEAIRARAQAEQEKA